MPPARQGEPEHDRHDAHADGEDEAEVHAGADGERREQRADDPADEPGEAPQAVEGGHDAAAVEAFDADGLRIHRDVVQVGRDAEEYQHGEKLPRFADEAEGHEGSRIEQGREEQHPVASEAADQKPDRAIADICPTGMANRTPPSCASLRSRACLMSGCGWPSLRRPAPEGKRSLPRRADRSSWESGTMESMAWAFPFEGGFPIPKGAARPVSFW